MPCSEGEVLTQGLRTNVYGVHVVCVVCDRTKKPRGRSAPMGLSMCDDDCPGYWQEPHVGSLWWSESEAEFGYPVGDVGIRVVSLHGAPQMVDSLDSQDPAQER